MAGRSSAAMVAAMNFILQANMTPYAAARRAQVNLTTMYRSPLYKLWRAGDMETLRRELDQTAPRPRRPTKKEKIMNK
jgi:hypothetical protein